MLERANLESIPSGITLDQIRYPTKRFGEIPLENIFRIGSRWSDDENTMAGINSVSAALDEGLVILLDAHFVFDGIAMPVTCAKILESFGPRIRHIVLPLSIKTLNDPRLNGLYTNIGSIKGIDIFAVYREGVTADEKGMFPHGMTEVQRRDENDKYVNAAVKMKNAPGSIVAIAAHGGKNKPKGYVPRGVLEVLRTGRPAFCTMSLQSRIAGHRVLCSRYKTYMASIALDIKEGSTDEEIYENIIETQRVIALTAGFDPDYFVGVKTS